jgi:hypothetical protein
MENYIATKIGYGNPYGNYWFIGPEEGGSIASLNQRIAIWNKLGKEQHFHDLKKFHLAYKKGTEHFFEGNIKLQRTWNGLIEILFGIKGKEIKLEAKKEYQSNQLGAEDGETLLAELFPFASKSLNDSEWNELFGESKKDYWEKYANQRIQLITEQIEIYKPKLVVFYSVSFQKQWMEIIGSLNAEQIEINNNNLPTTLFSNKSTTFCIVPHPVSIKMNGKVKYEIGRVLNEIKNLDYNLLN